MPIAVLVWVRSFVAPDFFWKQCTIWQYHSNLSDQSALKIRLTVALFLPSVAQSLLSTRCGISSQCSSSCSNSDSYSVTQTMLPHWMSYCDIEQTCICNGVGRFTWRPCRHQCSAYSPVKTRRTTSKHCFSAVNSTGNSFNCDCPALQTTCTVVMVDVRRNVGFCGEHADCMVICVCRHFWRGNLCLCFRIECGIFFIADSFTCLLHE